MFTPYPKHSTHRFDRHELPNDTQKELFHAKRLVSDYYWDTEEEVNGYLEGVIAGVIRGYDYTTEINEWQAENIAGMDLTHALNRVKQIIASTK